MNTNKYRKIVFIFIMFFLLIGKSNALTINDGGLSSGSNQPCGSGWNGYVACYTPKFQFRITLVDKNGNKVNGTRSVDFTYSEDGKTYDKTSSKKNKLLNTNYKYKYGTNNNSDFIYIETSLINNNYSIYRGTNGDNHENYGSFYDDFSNVIGSRINKTYYIGNLQKTDFVSMFLYYSGYINEQKKIEEMNDKLSEIAVNGYYMLIEPTYDIYYNVSTNGQLIHKYGTSSEIMEFMYGQITDLNGQRTTAFRNGYFAGLTLNFVYQTACNMYTTPSNARNIGFNRITMETNCEKYKTIDSAQEPRKKPNNLSQQERLPYIHESFEQTRGYGAAVMSLKEIITENVEIVFDVDLCESNDGKISVEAKQKDSNGNVSSIEEKNKTPFINEKIKINDKLYCYDDVVYDFSAIMNLKEQTYISGTNLEIPNIYVKINRHCYYDGVDSININDIQQSAIDTSEYPDEILLNLDEQQIKMETNLYSTWIQRKTDFDSMKQDYWGSSSGWIDYTITIEYSYKNNDNNSNITIPNLPDEDGLVKNGVIGTIGIETGNIKDMFGYSNNVLETLLVDRDQRMEFENMSHGKTFFSIIYSDGGNQQDNLTCDFNYNIKDDNIFGSGEGNLQFRVISLSNPFPARDGKSRLPGTNWLNEKNYVYNYITNNRGIQYSHYQNITRSTTPVSPELMYSELEPMYVITLDAPTMLKVREYNKNHYYSDIDLECNDNKRECISSFLRDENIINSDDFTGACSDASMYRQTEAELYSSYITMEEEELRNAIYTNAAYNSIYDFNRNNRLDTEDLEIYMNRFNNTIFYTCANKNVLSGG